MVSYLVAVKALNRHCMPQELGIAQLTNSCLATIWNYNGLIWGGGAPITWVWSSDSLMPHLLITWLVAWQLDCRHLQCPAATWPHFMVLFLKTGIYFRFLAKPHLYQAIGLLNDCCIHCLTITTKKIVKPDWPCDRLLYSHRESWLWWLLYGCNSKTTCIFHTVTSFPKVLTLSNREYVSRGS